MKTQAGFQLIPGVKSIKKASDYEFTGTKLVTLENGDVHSIYYDSQGLGYYHERTQTEGQSHLAGLISTQKSEVLRELLAGVASGKFLPNE